MSGRTLNVFGLAFLGVAAAVIPQAAKAGQVQILSQDGFVSVEVQTGRNDPLTSDREDAPASGSFSRTANADVALDGFTVDAESTADVALGQDGLTFAGVLRYDAADSRPDDPEGGIPSVKLDYEFQVTFSIDEAYDYNFRSTLTRGDDYAFNDLENLHVLRGIDVNFEDFDANSGGTLQPGTYELSVAQTARGLIGRTAELDAAYEVAVDLSPADGNGGGQPIPLPPAVWSGLLVLGAGALNRLRKSLTA